MKPYKIDRRHIGGSYFKYRVSFESYYEIHKFYEVHKWLTNNFGPGCDVRDCWAFEKIKWGWFRETHGTLHIYLRDSNAHSTFLLKWS